MDAEKHIEVLQQELDFCCSLRETVSWEVRLELAGLILNLLRQLENEKRKFFFTKKHMLKL